jgi:nitrate/nitrite transporter NarK
MQGILILVYTAGIVSLLRFFGGGLAHKLSPLRLLTIASVVACVGLVGLSPTKSLLGLFSAALLLERAQVIFGRLCWA